MKRIKHLYKNYGFGWHYVVYTRQWALLTIGRDAGGDAEDLWTIQINLWFVHIDFGFGRRVMSLGE